MRLLVKIGRSNLASGEVLSFLHKLPSRALKLSIQTLVQTDSSVILLLASIVQLLLKILPLLLLNSFVFPLSLLLAQAREEVCHFRVTF